MNLLLSNFNSIVGIVIDVFVAFTLLACIFVGLKKGLVNSILSILNNFVLLIASIFSAKYVAQLFDNVFNLITWSGDKITELISSLNEEFSVVFTGESLPTIDYLTAIINDSDIFGLLKNIMISIIENGTISEGGSIASMTGAALGAIAVTIASGILVFIVLKIVISLISNLFENINDSSKALSSVNKLLGGVFGILRATLKIGVLLTIVILLTLIPTVNNIVEPIIQDNTYVTKYVYNLTETVIDKYVIDDIGDWLNNLWDNRD